MPFVLARLVLLIELTPAHFIYTGPLLVATPALAGVTTEPRAPSPGRGHRPGPVVS
ncbi:hypothetical protein SSAG_00919 [Streptomyces sp. Mg1]|nr:hypothetical protein SSAG_00919 [Streptomyces sp. Mg1]